MEVITLLFQCIAWLLLGLLLVGSYKFVLTPYLKLLRMRRELKGKYSAYEHPFRPFGISFIQRLLEDFKQYGDNFRTRKHEFSKKDVVLATLRDRVMITLVNDKLVHKFIERHKEGCYAKVDSGINFHSLKNFLGDGLLLSEGEEWRYKRRVMGSLFSFEFVRSKLQMVLSIAQGECRQALLNSQEGVVELEVDKLFQNIFGTVVIRCFFGDIELQLIEGKRIFEFLNDLIMKIANRNMRVSSFVFGPVLMKYGVRQIDREITREINAFREYTRRTIDRIITLVESSQSNESEGLVAKLLREKKLVRECRLEEKIKQGSYTYEDLVNEMSTFFFAGTDTTSSSISFLVRRIVERGDVEEKLRREIKEVLDDDVRNITSENLKKMNYLRYCIEENLRMLPPVPHNMLREALCDHILGDIRILKGDTVSIEILANHYREEVFPDPFDFLPERWEKLEQQSDLSKYYFPFSLGPRVCIGQQLALLESKVALIVFLLSFKKGRAL
jgi:cytochrome P450